MSIFYPLDLFAEWLTFDVLSISKNSLLGTSLHFFIFDTLKIFILLYVLILLTAFLRSYISKDRIRHLLSHNKQYLGYFFASLLGVITPFCSCSAIPLFLSFLEASIPIGITFTFLIASPMINEVALIMLLGLFGIKIALLYVASGLFISVVSGLILAHLKVEKWILQDIIIKGCESSKKCSCQGSVGWKEKVKNSNHYTFSILKKIGIYVVLGIGLGAWIHGYVPDQFLVQYASANHWYDVPLVVALGVPLYSNAAGIIPLISSLIEKGLSLGTALAFMMAVTSLSLPEFLILKRIMQWKLLALFALVVSSGIVLIGYLFNWIL
jgi:uncharacterized membrane protein YraQ (UPF0718 family)